MTNSYLGLSVTSPDSSLYLYNNLVVLVGLYFFNVAVMFYIAILTLLCCSLIVG